MAALNKTALAAAMNAALANNNEGSIAPSVMRSVLQDFIDSLASLSNSTEQTFSSAVDFTDTLQQDGISVVPNVYSITFADTPYTITDKNAIVYANCTGGAITITLPAVAIGNYINVIKTDSSGNAATVGSASNINGAATSVIGTQYLSKQYISNATEYFIR